MTTRANSSRLAMQAFSEWSEGNIDWNVPYYVPYYSAKLGSDDLVQPFHHLRHFLGRRSADA